MDEAVEVLEQTDIEGIKNEQRSCAQQILEQRGFQREYIEHKRRIAAPKAKGKAGGKGGKAGVKTIPHHCDQLQAKAFLPCRDAHIWKGNNKGEWNAHLPPHKRVYEPHIRHGSSELALKACLKTVWAQYLAQHALPDSACWVEGLFEAE